MPGVRRIQANRQRRLQSVCKQFGRGRHVLNRDSIVDSDLSRIYVDDKYRFLYCEVPKVACTNWKRILLILTGKMNTTDPERLPSNLVHTDYQTNYLRTLNAYEPEEIALRIRRYYKFMFVREPLERILSAYRNKFVNRLNQRYPLRYGGKIISRYRKKPTNHSLLYGDDVRFSEFVQYLLHLKANSVFDVHWRPFYQICHPCWLRYNFIGKYETLDDDVNFILEELGVRHLLNFPEKPRSKTSKTVDILKSMFANISSEAIHDLWRLYSVDYSLFGYPYPDL